MESSDLIRSTGWNAKGSAFDWSGARRLYVADTVGHTVSDEVRCLVKLVQDETVRPGA
jgi:hypothetical protein